LISRSIDQRIDSPANKHPILVGPPIANPIGPKQLIINAPAQICQGILLRRRLLERPP